MRKIIIIYIASDILILGARRPPGPKFPPLYSFSLALSYHLKLNTNHLFKKSLKTQIRCIR